MPSSSSNKLPSEARIGAIYQKLTGKPMDRGQWDVRQRDFAQKVAYVEDACHAVLAAIQNLEAATDKEQIDQAVTDLRAEFRFLDTLRDN